MQTTGGQQPTKMVRTPQAMFPPTRMERDFEIFIKLIGRFLSTQGKKSMPLLCPSVRALPLYRASCTPLVSHGRGPA